MSRTKSRQNVEVCGDCGAPDPTWASLNRGILLCINCCSVHRSLGRHISQVKSLQKSTWSNTQLNMIYTLNNSGANNIWEHLLLENNSKFSKRKPSPKDHLSMKAEFIRAKHQQNTYVFRPQSEDGLLCVENELGKQLHASVRTSNLDTSFRLLIQGADPNYFHDEKGTTPLHVAVKSNQALQMELLMVYGADPSSPDAQGRTPIDYAKHSANKDLLNRLVEWQYEVTDKFSNYLTHRKPDHQNGIHFLLPKTGYKSDPASLSKLKKLPNHVFEELVMDVYDEVDRREIEAIWLSSVDTMELNTIPFLPVDQTLSTTRNQGRQKLARFTSPELKSLVFDILIETQRRQLNIEKGKGYLLPQLREYSQISDDDPLYDSVASDDDYAVVTPANVSENLDKSTTSTSPSSPNQTKTSQSAADERLEELTKKLQASDSTITDLRAEVSKLRACVESLKSENDELKTRLSQTGSEINCFNSHSKVNGDSGSHSLDGLFMNQGDMPKISMLNGRTVDGDLRTPRRNQRPSSMYETREGLRTPNWQALKNQLKQNEQRNVTQSLYSTSQGQTIMQCTEQVTKGIQQLCRCLQESSEYENCTSCADKIRYAVTSLASSLHTETDTDLVRNLLETVSHLHEECARLPIASKKHDKMQVDHHLIKIRECAYNIAKDTKEIVTKYSAPV